MEYRIIDFSTNPFLQKYLQNIYVLSNGDKEFIYGCVPNGEIGISVIMNGNSEMKTDNGWVRQPKLSVYGLVKKVQFHKMSPYYHEINLGFKPHYLQLFMKDNLSGLEDRVATDLNFLFQKKEVENLFESLMENTTDEEILGSIEHILQNHLRREKIDKRILGAHDLICRDNIWNVERLSSLLNISSTGLRNIFKEKMGISPKDLIKILRVKKTLNINEHSEESLTALAYKIGYYDQAHFIHDFKDAIGLTPKDYFSNKKLTFDFYNFQRWGFDSFTAS